MITLREAAQQALEALEHGWIEKGDEVVAALKAALKQPQRHVSYVCPQCHWSLEQPEQEPVALFTKYGPPTMRDRDFWSTGYATATARAIEAALKERNA